MLRRTVMPGDVFYVGATLDASVCCGGIVDTSHTLRMRFNDASQLSGVALAGVAAIPEPTTLLLVLPSLALIAFTHRRQRQRPAAFAPMLSNITVYK